MMIGARCIGQGWLNSHIGYYKNVRLPGTLEKEPTKYRIILVGIFLKEVPELQKDYSFPIFWT